MIENFKEEELTQQVKNETRSEIAIENLAIANEKTSNTIEGIKTETKGWINYLSYMNPITLEFFAAETYNSIIENYEVDELPECTVELTIVLEDILGSLDANSGIDDSVDSILKILKDYYDLDTTNQDIAVFKIIANSYKRHSMGYYLILAKIETQKANAV
jgi:hypothetical protein